MHWGGGEVVKVLGSILSGDGELLPSGVTLSDLLLEGWSPGGGRGLGVSPEGDSGWGGGGAGKVGLVNTGKAARRWPPGMVQTEGGGGRDREETPGRPSLGLGLLWRHVGWRLREEALSFATQIRGVVVSGGEATCRSHM